MTIDEDGCRYRLVRDVRYVRFMRFVVDDGREVELWRVVLCRVVLRICNIYNISNFRLLAYSFLTSLSPFVFLYSHNPIIS